MKKLIFPIILILFFIFNVNICAYDEYDRILTCNGDTLVFGNTNGICESSINSNVKYYDSRSIKKIIFTENVKSITENSFISFVNVENIELGEADDLHNIGFGVFNDTAYYKNPLNWQEGVLYIGDCLIRADPETIGTEYTVLPGTRLIADRAFSDCEGLTDIHIPKSVKYVGVGAFSGTALYEKEELWDNGILYIDSVLVCADPKIVSGDIDIREGTVGIADHAFESCHAIRSVRCPESVRYIGIQAFADCRVLESIDIAETDVIGSGAFTFCSALENITVSENNEGYEILEGVLYNKGMTEVIRCPQMKKGVICLPKSVLRIGEYAFSECKDLKRIVFSEGLQVIRKGAFAFCQKLTDVLLPKSLRVIEPNAFTYCEGLVDIIVPNGVIKLGLGAFSHCTNLESASIGDGIRIIEDYLFECCTALKNVELGLYVNNISRYAFSESKILLDEENYDNGLLILSDKYLIMARKDLSICDIPEGIWLIADGAFYDVIRSETLERINLPKGIYNPEEICVYGLDESIDVYFAGALSECELYYAELASQINLYTSDIRTNQILAIVLYILLGVIVLFVFAWNDFPKCRRKDSIKITSDKEGN